MSIECFVLSEEGVIKVGEVNRGESLVLGEKHPALEFNHFVRAINPDLLEHSFLDDKGRQKTRGLRKEKINAANIIGFISTGELKDELIAVRWIPSIYGEDGQPHITCRGFDFAKTLLSYTIVDVENLLSPPI